MPDFDRDTLGLATLRTAVSVGHDNSPTLRGGSQEALPCRCFMDVEGRGNRAPARFPTGTGCHAGYASSVTLQRGDHRPEP